MSLTAAFKVAYEYAGLLYMAEAADF